MMRDHLVALAAFSAAIAIAAGAFGAHSASGDAVDWLKTGGTYQLTHAVAVIVLAERYRGPALTVLIGSLIFALSLYALAIGAPRWLGAITPIGGVTMIIGWLGCGYRALRQRSEQ
jgi:uncharacterized membrane protein YgdD (TMEM256/DUF423 family)